MAAIVDPIYTTETGSYFIKDILFSACIRGIHWFCNHADSSSTYGSEWVIPGQHDADNTAYEKAKTGSLINERRK